MKFKMIFILIAAVPSFLFSSENIETDIIPRTVNFLIFAGIIYYLLADKIRNYLNERTSSIQMQLDEVQKKVEESKKQLETARVDLENAKNLAASLIRDANIEVSSIRDRIAKGFENEIITLSKNFNDKVELETRKMKREITEEIVIELLNDQAAILSQDGLEKIILKKVA